MKSDFTVNQFGLKPIAKGFTVDNFGDPSQGIVIPSSGLTQTLQRGSRTQFLAPAVGGAVWTLDSAIGGTLSQSGVFTAGSSAGTVTIRAHTSYWGTVNPSYYTKNADDTCTKNTASTSSSAELKSAFYVNNIGDKVTAIVPRTSFPYAFGLLNDAQEYQLIYYAALNPNFIKEFHTAASINTNNAPTGGAWIKDDAIEWEMIAGGLIRIKRNGTTAFTSTQDFRTRNMRFVQDAMGVNGEVIKVPFMTASGYAEHTAVITIP